MFSKIPDDKFASSIGDLQGQEQLQLWNSKGKWLVRKQELPQTPCTLICSEAKCCVWKFPNKQSESILKILSAVYLKKASIVQSVTLQPVAGGTSYSGYAGIYPQSHSTATSCSSP